MADLIENGHSKAPGVPLERDGKVVSDKQTVIDGLYVDAKGSLILDYGGTVEVRRL